MFGDATYFHDDHVPIGLLVHSEYGRRCPTQPNEDLLRLAETIRERGVVQQLHVRPAGANTGFEVIQGHRRLEAARIAGIDTVSVRIWYDLSEREALHLVYLDHVERTDLNVMERARLFTQLLREFGYSQRQLAPMLRMTQSNLAHILAVLRLPPEITTKVEAGLIHGSVAQRLATLRVPDEVKLDLAEWVEHTKASQRKLNERIQELRSDFPAAVAPPRHYGRRPPVAAFTSAVSSWTRSRGRHSTCRCPACEELRQLAAAIEP